MKTIIPFGTLLLALILVPGSLGQSKPPLDVGLDHATFAFDTDQSMLEVYMAFGAASLDYEEAEGNYLTRLPLTLSVVHSTAATLSDTPNEPVWQSTLTLDFAINDTVGLAQGQYFVRQARLTVPPGEYELRVVIPADEAQGRQELELRRDVLVPDFADNGLIGLSDVTLATSIARSDERDDLYYKNGLIIRPNANQLYGEGMANLFYYAEAYNADAIASEDDEYTLLTYIAEANKPQPLPGLQKRSQRQARATDVLVGTFKLSDLPSGSYFLRIVLLDENNEASAEQSRKFFIYNPNVAQEPVVALETSFETSAYATMPAEEVERGLEHMRVIATEQDRRRARNIEDLDEQRRFLMDFWQTRDPDPSTPANEFREEFYGRIQYANERYTVRGMEGWKTDRGQTVIKFGLPSAIDPHLYDRGFKPYEVWEFNNIPGEGQAVFVFADRDGFGEFELIHSTVAGERKLANWQQELSDSYSN